MKTAQNVGCEVDSWIAEEELPASAQLKVIRQNDPDYGLTEDELDERNQFIQWYLLQDYAPLLSAPRQASEAGFFIPEVDVTSPEYSAFNTHDFQDGLQTLIAQDKSEPRLYRFRICQDGQFQLIDYEEVELEIAGATLVRRH